MKFDPFGMASSYLGEDLLYKIVRTFMTLLLAVFLLHRFSQYNSFTVKALWLTETALFTVILTAYLLRARPVNRSSGLTGIVVPLIGSALPFALLLSPPAQQITANGVLFHGLLWGMAASTALTAWGAWTLRRSFSITVEARILVTAGPYRLVRHPVYCGEILAAAAVAAIRFSLANISILLMFITIQLYRSRLEERKLLQTFPEYRQHLADSFWFWRL